MAFDAFLKIGTIPGESTDDKHADWIEVLSYNHGLAQQTSGSVSSGGGRTAARTDHQDFGVVKALDKASPKLALACSNGEHIQQIEVQLCRAVADKTQYMSYKMYDVIVSSVSTGGDSGSDSPLPSETVTFGYGKIEWTYTETDHQTGKPKGDIKTFWDLVRNAGG